MTNTQTDYNYEYALTDHLGNTRVSFDTYGHTTANQVQADDYYPFDLDISLPPVVSTANL